MAFGDASAPGQPGERSIGRYVTVQFAGASDGEPYLTVREDELAVVLAAARREPRIPAAGEEVTCSSVAGQWTTTVRSLRAGTIELDTPSWLSRDTRRRWPRATITFPVSVTIDGAPWAAQVVDLSIGGAGLMIEEAAALAEGARLEVELPTSSALARVRSVRRHTHPLLVIAGVSWLRLSPEAQTWLVGEVRAHRGQRHGAPREPPAGAPDGQT